MPALDPASCLSATGDGVSIRIKVVPGASRNRIAGMLGDRLKVAVAAPAEGGKANRAVCELMAEVFGLSMRDVEIIDGHTQPRKTVGIIGVTLCHVVEMLKRLHKE